MATHDIWGEARKIMGEPPGPGMPPYPPRWMTIADFVAELHATFHAVPVADEDQAPRNAQILALGSKLLCLFATANAAEDLPAPGSIYVPVRRDQFDAFVRQYRADAAAAAPGSRPT